MISSAVSYDQPQAAFLMFGIILFLGLSWALFQYRQRMQSSFIPEAYSAKLIVSRSSLIFWSKSATICSGWVLCSLALMEPKGNGHYPEGLQPPKEVSQSGAAELRFKAHEVIFLVDASASMSCTDTREHETRLDYAKDIADEIISDLTGETASLYAFTSIVTQLSPPTLDYLYVRLKLREMQINEGGVAGTNLMDALEYMRKQEYVTPSKKLWTLVLLTDGGDIKLESLQGAQREQEINAITKLVDNAGALNLRVFTVGLGTQAGQAVPGILYQGKPVISKLQDDVLLKLSEIGRGKYYYANDYTSIDIAANIMKIMNQDNPYIEKENVEGLKAPGGSAASKENLVYDLYYQYPLGIAIFLLAFAFFFPDTLTRQNRLSELIGFSEQGGPT